MTRKEKRKKIIQKYLRWLPKRKINLSILGGVLFFFTTPPFNLWILGFFLFIPFFMIEEEEENWGKIFIYGWIFGLVMYFTSFFWLVDTIQIFGGLPYTASIFVYIFFCLIFALKYAFFFWIAKMFRTYGIPKFLSYGSALLIVEIFYPEIFPFYVGNSQLANYYFIQIIDAVGIKGMSFILVLCNSLIYDFIFARNRKIMLILASLVFMVYSYGIIRVIQIKEHQSKAPFLNIGIIQPDTPFITSITQTTLRMIDQTVLEQTRNLIEKAGEDKLDLIVWPESATPFQISEGAYADQFLLSEMKKIIEKEKVGFIFSEIDLDAYFKGKNLYSTATIMGTDGKKLDSYNKIYLLPFGEYLPLGGFFPSLYNLFPQVGKFQSGTEIKNFQFKGINLSPQICYEIINPDLVRKFVRKGGDVIINLTNDKWFGQTNASLYHLWLLVPRAIENRVPLVRATNSGISAVIDQTGEMIAGPTDIFVKDILSAKVFIVKRIFGLYSYIGDFLLIFIILFSLYLVYKDKYIYKTHLQFPKS
ncbi:MAG TPA: apolipoprotein N-acyltransferase [Spirochaetia bacterium]|nr:MAG: apolipoprotein N-acyltransferase [Spirochaetes bacterium GWB1_36_13]HCL56762.1 apolipoprotein N-acyltransferase [Spirochaetia bacterium]